MKGVNIYGKYGIPNLSDLSKLSYENEILSQSGDQSKPLLIKFHFMKTPIPSESSPAA